eukprot:Nitzschia sp. Nitz4//scaffold4_size323378//170333//170737//NITZ4_000666-RA/size323378-processed-gene-0.286-mRNA-1//1//CDS//3329553417//4007//frame0
MVGKIQKGEKRTLQSQDGKDATKASSKTTPTKGSTASKSGLDEIDALFSEKKKRARTEPPPTKRKPREPIPSRKHPMPTSGAEWVDDGLGGKYNAEGYTGRVEDGVKVFKRHILNKPNAGYSKDCPFDCQCCFI